MHEPCRSSTYLSVMWMNPWSNGMSAWMMFAMFPKPDEILSKDGPVRLVEDAQRLVGLVTFAGLVSEVTT